MALGNILWVQLFVALNFGETFAFLSLKEICDLEQIPYVISLLSDFFRLTLELKIRSPFLSTCTVVITCVCLLMHCMESYLTQHMISLYQMIIFWTIPFFQSKMLRSMK